MLAPGCGDEGGPAVTQPVVVTESSFGCISDLTAVRRFFIGDLGGDPTTALAVARGEMAPPYPAGTIMQLLPAAAMVKREPGFSSRSNDWEFFALDPLASGTVITERGLDTLDITGGTCLDCHRATPETDFVCETENGCPEIPIDETGIRALQAADPRCE